MDLSDLDNLLHEANDNDDHIEIKTDQAGKNVYELPKSISSKF
jgi:hypothetical protein